MVKDANSCLQVIAAAEAFRIKCLQARKGSRDEHLLWISGSCSQPVAEALAIMAGEMPLHCTYHPMHAAG